MALFRRRRRSGDAGSGPRYGRAGIAAEDLEHLRRFVASRRGVEAYLEPATNVTPWTVVLVAHDGEWTRRPCDGPEAARGLAHGAAIPLYDVKATGYPARMRAWSSSRRRATDPSGRPPAGPGGEGELPPDPFV